MLVTLQETYFSEKLFTPKKKKKSTQRWYHLSLAIRSHIFSIEFRPNFYVEFENDKLGRRWINWILVEAKIWS